MTDPASPRPIVLVLGLVFDLAVLAVTTVLLLTGVLAPTYGVGLLSLAIGAQVQRATGSRGGPPAGPVTLLLLFAASGLLAARRVLAPGA